MPFVNGKYYMNPQYGRAMERARTSRRGSLDAAIRSIRTKSLWPAIEGLLGDESQSPSDSETNNPPRALPRWFRSLRTRLCRTITEAKPVALANMRRTIIG